MPTWGEVGFVVAIGVGVMLTIEVVKVVLRKRYEPGSPQPQPA
jgi:hypothetical protein